jgi:hypothetical protein
MATRAWKKLNPRVEVKDSFGRENLFLDGLPKKNRFDTPAFRAWFGDSVFRDAAGTPIPMYHGTAAPKFTEFTDWRPAFFTPDRAYAEVYAQKGGQKSRIYEVFLRMEKPFDPSTDERARRVFNEEFLPYWEKKYPRLFADGRYRPLAKGEKVHFVVADQVWAFLRYRERQQGAEYDGLVVDEGGFSDTSAFVPLFSTQIKSVKNKGTFDPKDPNILNGLPTRGRIPLATAKRALKALPKKYQTCGITPSLLREGMEIEREHRDVTRGRVGDTAKTAAVHICEHGPKYYPSLKKLERKLKR